ncbi:alpha/beta hydrolase [Aquibacillus kalidii]|uniref:alpha/beta hydrolase n=1 Tax=Aquibacillus kalidii TaxID=2762597 RepID=UPI001F2E30B5|nr:alpha/beta hydrolase [Aquibacillus kalidii]
MILISLSILLVLLIILVGAGNYFYSESVKRGVQVELHSEPESVNAIAEQSNQLLDESLEWYEQNKNKFETVEQTSYDGLILKAQFLNNENGNGNAVILAHGYRGDHKHMSEFVKFYVDQGFDVLMPDARGHGQSEGDYIGYGWHDRIDYQGWINKLIKEQDTENIFLHGISMGAGLVLMTSGEELPEQVKGIIADSGYSSVEDELNYQLKNLYHLPSFPLMNITSLITKVRAGYTFEEASAIEQVKKNTRPLFLIHGDADELVPTYMANEIYDVANGDKQLWIVPKAGHTKSYSVATEEYQKRLTDFIESSLK